MAERNPDVPQSDDPDLLAALVRFLRIVGPLGRLNVADLVLPVISVGSVGTPAMTTLQPAFRQGGVFSAGVFSGAAAFAEHARAELLRGTYDIQLYISPHTTEAHVWDITIGFVPPSTDIWSVIVPIDGPGLYQTFAWEFDEPDFIRIRNTTGFGPGVQSVAAIFARLRT